MDELTREDVAMRGVVTWHKVRRLVERDHGKPIDLNTLEQLARDVSMAEMCHNEQAMRDSALELAALAIRLRSVHRTVR